MVRLRPVPITVGATVFGLVPLAVRGGPLRVPMCLAQIGGLTVATVATLALVPVIDAIAVEDLWGSAVAQYRVWFQLSPAWNDRSAELPAGA